MKNVNMQGEEYKMLMLSNTRVICQWRLSNRC